MAVEGVCFFGSRSREAARVGSDVDVLLISPAFPGKDIFARTRMLSGVHRSLAKRFYLSFDLVFCSPDEWRHSSSPLLQELPQVA